MSEGGSWKGLLCSFIGSTITNIPSVNLAVQHNTTDDALVLELRQALFFRVCMHVCVFVECLKRCSQLCIVTDNSLNPFTRKLKVHIERKQAHKIRMLRCFKHNGHVNQVGTSSVTKTGLSPSCIISSYQAKALRQDQERVTLSVAKSDTGFHMLDRGFFFPLSLTPSRSLSMSCYLMQ